MEFNESYNIFCHFICFHDLKQSNTIKNNNDVIFEMVFSNCSIFLNLLESYNLPKLIEFPIRVTVSSKTLIDILITIDKNDIQLINVFRVVVF